MCISEAVDSLNMAVAILRT